MKRIFDPVHGFIELYPAEARLLDLPVMQRLRRLRQLGLAYLAFPAAEHSRFTHAVGALAMGTRVFDTITRDDAGILSDRGDVAYQRRLVRAALLLHDVGHGPFSHACESALGVRHESRTERILAMSDVRDGLDACEVDASDVLGLILGNSHAYPALREIVSGPNLDADRMDYLLRDAYFTGVVSGRYDADQLVASMRLIDRDGASVLGIDVRGVVSLESFILARYMMFASVYFHHTTRMFERVLYEVLTEMWPDPHTLDPIDEFLRWDDFRVIEHLRDAHSDAARALRDRLRIYALAAEFNASSDLADFEACQEALCERFGAENVWADEQSQVLHRLPMSADHGPTVWVKTRNQILDARAVSDLIAKLTGKAYWRKLFVTTAHVDVAQAREVCATIVGRRHAAM
ncbi:MAG: HD domain-containing protein [Vulcanimicrobiaceae bacterium]